MPSRIDVLVLTYNGERYLQEQLDSILKQIASGDRVIISDDGSTDKTIDIIQRYQEKSKHEIQLVYGSNEGVVNHFFKAIAHTQAPYVMVADQDDVWVDNKVHLFKELMVKPGEPHLIFSDAYSWWPDSDVKHSFWKEQGINPEHSQSLRTLLFRNCVQGASMAISQELIQNATYVPRHAMMHDWWMALLATSTGSIDYIPAQTLLYRQHAGNQIGANLQRSFQQKRQATLGIFKQAVEFEQSNGLELNPKDAKLLRDFSRSIQGSLTQRLAFILRHKPIRSNFLRSITLWASMLALKPRTLSKR